MKAFFVKVWPSLAHALGVVILFLNSSVQSYAASHPAYAAGVLLVWGWLLHWATSPKNTLKN